MNKAFRAAVVIRAASRLSAQPTKSEAMQAIEDAMEEELAFEAEMAAGATRKARRFRSQLAKNVWHNVRVESALGSDSITIQ